MPRLRRPTTLYESIAAHYRRLIASGMLRPGDQLPPVRDLPEVFEAAVDVTVPDSPPVT